MAIDRSKQKKLDKNAQAVPTKRGWVDPKSGELLVSIRGLPNAYDWDSKTNTFSRGGKEVDLVGNKKKADTSTTVPPAETPVRKPEPNKDEAPVKTEQTTNTVVTQDVTVVQDPAEAAKPKKEKKPRAPRKKKADSK